ncbi:hypothetical protein ANANG_G00043350 [Anguilla anguilla]|uniref:Uncharacterized protein n=1 Tax=Anguilla anguilla TaxID=7936 RepID=A0A9D3S9J6_ANGAN|nr:hypothetical protein ANANG_G00043350 [Anguilla anguilla]
MSDVEKYIQVRANVEKAQERHKEAYQRRTKKETKCFKISPGIEVLTKDGRKCGRPARTMDPDWPTKYRVTEVEDNNLVQLETMDGKPLKTKTSYASVKPLHMRSQAGQPTEEAVPPPAESVHSDDPQLHNFELEEDPLQACAALLNRRVEDFGAVFLGQHTRLDDKVIDHAQALMKMLHPYIGGLHATTLPAVHCTYTSSGVCEDS